MTNVPTTQAPYKQVGAALRQALDRASHAHPRLSGSDWRVFGAVLYLTASRSKLEDLSYNERVAELADMTGDPKRAATSLRKLSKLNVIVYEPSKAHGQMSRYGLPPAP